MKQLLKFKQELIKELKKEENKWHCKLCDKDFPPGDYCVEHHFEDVHNLNTWSASSEHDHKWECVSLDESRVIKCIERVYRRLK